MFGINICLEILTPGPTEPRVEFLFASPRALSKTSRYWIQLRSTSAYMSIGAALALIGFTMEILPTVNGVNLVYGSAIAALLAVPQMIVYTIMQRHVSRTGGDYVWLSRSLGGFAGSTLTFMGMTLETMPYLALIALSVCLCNRFSRCKSGLLQFCPTSNSRRSASLAVPGRFGYFCRTCLAQYLQASFGL